MSRATAFVAAAAVAAAASGAAATDAGGGVADAKRHVLAYTKNADTTRQSVWIGDRDGRNARQVGRGRAPVVSPDGARVAFAGGCRGDPPTDCTKLYVVTTTGAAPRLLGRAEGPVWSPDSTRVVARSGRKLVSIDVDSARTVVLDRGAFFGWSVAPSGGRVVYGRGPSDNPLRGMDLFTVPIGGGARRQLTHDRRSGNPVWGPRAIAFTRFVRRGGYPAYDLWTMRDDGGGARLLVRGKTVADRYRLSVVLGLFPVEWAADGRRLLTTYMTEQAETPFALDLRTGRVRLLWHESSRDVSAAGFSSDGGTVLLQVVPRSEVKPTYVATVPWAGGRATVLVRNASEPSWNRWAPGRASAMQTSAGRAFRAAGGAIFCKLDDSLEENPFVECWRPRDGRVVSIEHAMEQPGRTSVDAPFKGRAPARYPVVPTGSTWVWRCRTVNPLFVRLCSPTRGKLVFFCWSNRTGVRCENRHGHGFVLARARVYRVF